jgi:hypothetical protein
VRFRFLGVAFSVALTHAFSLAQVTTRTTKDRTTRDRPAPLRCRMPHSLGTVRLSRPSQTAERYFAISVCLKRKPPFLGSVIVCLIDQTKERGFHPDSSAKAPKLIPFRESNPQKILGGRRI